MDKVIKELSTNYDFFKSYAIQLAKDDFIGEELLHQCFIYVSDIFNKEKFQDAYENGYLHFLFINVMKMQFFSTTSNFHRDIIKYTKRNYELTSPNVLEEEKNIDETTTYIGIINEILRSEEKRGKLDWWEVQVFKEYHYGKEKTTFQKMEDETKIPGSTIWCGVQKVEKLIKRKLKNYEDRI